jgi:hypothetical protein
MEESRSNILSYVRVGIVLVVVLIGAAAVFPSLTNFISESTPPETVRLECIIGSEKSGFLSNPEVQDILARDYAIEVSFRRMGSIEQVRTDITGIDCLWPSNTSALEIFRTENPALFDNGQAESEVIFNSPIVLYSWATIVEALEAQGFIYEENGHYNIDSDRLIETMVTERPTWQDLGVDELFGSFNIITTDPTRSNSGNMFYALIANMMLGGEIATADTIDSILPEIKAYYDAQGRLEESSGFLFEQYIITGMGAHPIIANYESLILEFLIENPDQSESIQEQIRVIYPKPTVWSSHPLIALSGNGQVLLDALKDERLQQIAWEQHGFRSGLAGIVNDPASFNLDGLASDITSVIPLPRSEAILEMLDYLEN